MKKLHDKINNDPLWFLDLIVVFIFAVYMVWALFFNNVEAAEQDALYLHTISYHENRAADYNEMNYGVGFRNYVDNPDYKFHYANFGIYKNSEDNVSTYVGVGWEWDVGSVKLGVVAGAITGYSLNEVLPYFLPTARYGRFTLVMAPYPEPVVSLTYDVAYF